MSGLDLCLLVLHTSHNAILPIVSEIFQPNFETQYFHVRVYSNVKLKLDDTKLNLWHAHSYVAKINIQSYEQENKDSAVLEQNGKSNSVVG